MSKLNEVREFVQDVDPTLQRTFEFRVDDVADSGSGGGQYTMVGHAAVFNRWSLDLGGFKEKIDKKAFDNVLSGDPHVLHVIDHDTRFVLSSTRNQTLELSTDPKGLRYWSKVAPTSYAADLRILLERGDITQSSFAFTVSKDEWKITGEGENETVERTILEVKDLFDVTTCAMGAYPATDSALALRSLLRQKPELPVLWTPDLSGTVSGTTGNYVISNPVVAHTHTAGDKTEDAPDEPVVAPRVSDEDTLRAVRALKIQSELGLQAAKDRLFRGKEL